MQHEVSGSPAEDPSPDQVSQHQENQNSKTHVTAHQSDAVQKLDEVFSGAVRALRDAGRIEEAEALADLDRLEQTSAAQSQQKPSMLRALVWEGATLEKSSSAELAPEAVKTIAVIAERVKEAVAADALYETNGASSDPKGVRPVSSTVTDELKSQGLHKFLIPEEYGGLGYGFDAQLRLFEELSRNGGFHVVATTSGSTVIGPVQPVLQHGTEDQKARILPLIANGGDGFFALTQSNAGVNVPGMGAYAIKTSDGAYELYAQHEEGAPHQDDNRKWYITGADRGNTGIVVVKDRETGARQMFLLTIPKEDTDTFQLHKYPISAFATIENNGFTLAGFRVEEADRIDYDGLKALFANLNNGRAALGAMYAGLSDYLIAQSRTWISERRTLGNQPLEKAASNTVYRLGLMTALSTGLKGITEFTAQSIAEGRDTALEAVITKWFAGYAGREMQDHMQEIIGGRAFEQNHPMGRFNSDLLVVRTFEGPNTPIAGKLFNDLTKDHIASKLDPLSDILDKHGVTKLEMASPTGAAIILESLARPEGRSMAAWSAAQELQNIRRKAARALGIERDRGLPRELAPYASYAQDVLEDYPRWVTKQLQKQGKELLDDTPAIEKMAERVIFATVMYATIEYAKDKEPTVVESAKLLCDLLRDEITHTCADYRARSHAGRLVGRMVLSGEYSAIRDVPRAPGLFS